jgi:hypothetical protein
MAENRTENQQSFAFISLITITWLAQERSTTPQTENASRQRDAREVVGHEADQRSIAAGL